MAKIVQDKEPTCYDEAIGNMKWEQAMDEEMAALDVNETWELVPLPEGKKFIGCKWVYRVKHNADGSISRYKAKLVAKGYAQTYGIDYEETFNLVAKMATVRTVIAMAASKGWLLHQMDVAYLVVAIGFHMADADHSLYVRKNENDIVIVCIYVDDLIIGGDNEGEIMHIKSLLKKEFDMKDLGELGIEIIHTKEDQNVKLRADKGQVLEDVTMYRQIVGSLIYVTISRPHLSYTVGLESQFMQLPRKPHLDVVRCTLRYDILRVFEKFDTNRDGLLSKEVMFALVVAVNGRVQFSEDSISAILDEVFRIYGDYIDDEKGLTFEGLLQTYDDGAGHVVLYNRPDSPQFSFIKDLDDIVPPEDVFIEDPY
ncbi:hypothetical protein L7F22_003462 [Adiantum nelumboides]|nr:hypothetical protein [Adiantum nelumboides]